MANANDNIFLAITNFRSLWKAVKKNNRQGISSEMAKAFTPPPKKRQRNASVNQTKNVAKNLRNSHQSIYKFSIKFI